MTSSASTKRRNAEYQGQSQNVNGSETNISNADREFHQEDHHNKLPSGFVVTNRALANHPNPTRIQSQIPLISQYHKTPDCKRRLEYNNSDNEDEMNLLA